MIAGKRGEECPMLPFTHDAFVDVFRAYNEAIWPAQLAAYVLGAVAVLAALRPGPASDRLVLSVLAAMWIWTGILYHGVFFSTINAVAVAFGIGFVLQGGLFAMMAARGTPSAFAAGANGTSLLGLALVAYAMLLYPLVGSLAGQVYPGIPMFGVAPCPVVIFTFGLLLMAERAVPAWVIVIPGLWSLIGGSAAFLLAVPQDWLLLLSGAMSVPLILRNRRIASRAFRRDVDASGAGAHRAAAYPQRALRR
jgi:hypothetical protein